MKIFAFIRLLGKAAFFITLSLPEAQLPDLLKHIITLKVIQERSSSDEDSFVIQSVAARIVGNFTERVKPFIRNV